jgi:hypothetical protein
MVDIKRKITIRIILLLLASASIVFAAGNRHGAKVSAVTTSAIGLAHHKQARGYKVTAAISPYAAARSHNLHGQKVIIGPAAIVQHAAAHARARNWSLYE